MVDVGHSRALHFVNLAASLCQIKVRTHTHCCLVLRNPFIAHNRFMVDTCSNSCLTLERTNGGHSGPSRLRLGASCRLGTLRWIGCLTESTWTPKFKSSTSIPKTNSQTSSNHLPRPPNTTIVSTFSCSNFSPVDKPSQIQ